MKQLKLTAKDAAQEKVKEYLEQNVSDLLAEKINTGEKTLQGCWNYIVGEAKQKAVSGCACIEDREVFGWAVHYFEEDSIAECKSAPPVKTVTSKAEKKPTTPPKNATKTPEKATPPTNTPAPTKKPSEAKNQTDQLSIFDLFG